MAKKGTLFGKPIGQVIKHPGALHRDLGVPQGQKIPAKKLAKAAAKGGKIGQRARLAQTLKGFHHSGGHHRTSSGRHSFHNLKHPARHKEKMK